MATKPGQLSFLETLEDMGAPAAFDAQLRRPTPAPARRGAHPRQAAALTAVLFPDQELVPEPEMGPEPEPAQPVAPQTPQRVARLANRAESAAQRGDAVAQPAGWLLSILTATPDIYGLLAAGPDESRDWLRTYALRWIMVGQGDRVPTQHWWDWWSRLDLGTLAGSSNVLLRLLDMEQWYVEKIGLYGEDGYLAHGLIPLLLLARHGCPPPKEGRDKAKYARGVSEWELELAHRFVGLARVAKRWQYWLHWLEAGDYPPGRRQDRTLNELARIPQLEFPEYQSERPTGGHPEERLRCKVRKNIVDTLDMLHITSGSADKHVVLMDFVLHAIGQKPWDRGVELYDKIARIFDVVGFVAFPADWLGDILAEEERGRSNAFYPTPMNLVQLMVRMTMMDRQLSPDAATWTADVAERYCRDATGNVLSGLDPCGGTMRMNLFMSNYMLNLSYMDIWYTAWTIALAYGCCWVPWMAAPMGSVPMGGVPACGVPIGAVPESSVAAGALVESPDPAGVAA